MDAILIEIPKDLAESMRLPLEEQPMRIRQELAVRLYQKDLLTFGKARQLAGMSKWEFHFLLGEEGISRRYDVEELSYDLRTLESLD